MEQLTLSAKPSQKPKLLDQMRYALRVLHYSYETEKAYIPWIYHLEKIKKQHEKDLKDGFGTVEMPYALAKKYPNIEREWGWQYVFPASKISTDTKSGIRRRHHLDPSAVQKAVKKAKRAAGIHKHAKCHTFKHSFTTHLLEAGQVMIYLQSRNCEGTKT